MISGRVSRIIYRNGNFCIFGLKTVTGELKCKGTFLGIEIRQHMDVELEGTIQNNQKYGETLDVKTIKEIEPNDVDGIIRYLEANVKGVGYTTARKIAKHFGENTVKILIDDPNKIQDVSFLTDLQKELIYKALTENAGYRDISVFLMSFDVSPMLVESIYKKWGNDAVSVLTENPYQLMVLHGVAFKKADEIATRMGIDPRAPIRIQAVIKYVLEEVIEKEGHLYVMKDVLQDMCIKLLDGVSSKSVCQELEHLIIQGDIVQDHTRIYSKHNFYSEQQAAERLSAMLGPVDRSFDVESFIDEYEKTHSTEDTTFRFSDEQRLAIETSVISKVMIITGLPGTGKTTILKAIVQMFERFYSQVVLMAPTGIAAKKLSITTGRKASTIHRALKCVGAGEWDHNENNPHPADGVVVDEFSMVDMSLFNRLLRGIKDTASMVFVGDVAQLPSVGPGSVLRELISSRVVPVIELKIIHRQEEASDIILNAHKIQSGESLVIDNNNPKTDFKFVHLTDEDQLLERIRRTAKALQNMGLSFQCLSPRHAGILGVSNLNNCLRDDLNPDVDQPSAQVGNKLFRVGDRIMVTKNNYEKKVYNGDIGNIIEIDKKNQSIQFHIEGNEDTTTFTYSEAYVNLVLAYCVTVHKSQGSEWDIVMMTISKNFGIQLVRNLFYTGVTRARKKVFCYGQLEAAEKAIRNNRVAHRNTLFGTRLRNLVLQNA